MSNKFDYAAFEDHFRGDAREIRRKLSAYVPLLRQIRFNESSPAFDIGCGRGEWLSLLVENGIPAYGVNNNADFVVVQEQDLYIYLDDRTGQQYDLISGSHVIERFDISAQQAILRKT